MSITNAERHDPHKGLEEMLGEERANVLMEHLPPVGWADVATRRDLDNLEERLRGEFRHEIGAVRTDLQLQISELRGALAGQQLRHTMALVGILGTLMAILSAFG
jgi:hypothetical protein